MEVEVLSLNPTGSERRGCEEAQAVAPPLPSINIFRMALSSLCGGSLLGMKEEGRPEEPRALRQGMASFRNPSSLQGGCGVNLEHSIKWLLLEQTF